MKESCEGTVETSMPLVSVGDSRPPQSHPPEQRFDTAAARCLTNILRPAGIALLRRPHAGFGAGRFRLWSLLLVISAGICLCSTACAQRKYPVGLKLEALSIRGRSAGPIPLRIKLEYNSNQKLEGDLLMHIYNSVQTPNDLLATIRYEGIFLQGSDYIFTTVLPPFEHSFNKQYLIESYFVTESGRIPLSPDDKNDREPRELLSIGSYERSTLLCSCSGDQNYQRPSANRQFLNLALALDNYNPLVQGDSIRNRQKNLLDSQRVQNYAVGWDALDLPEDPLRLCCFDVVLLADGALGRLDEAQMRALTTWVEAGGSLCVLPDDVRLTGTHLQFLQRLFERPGDAGLHLSLTDDGELLVISDENEPIVNRHHGLGRATLLPNVKDLPSRLMGAELGHVVGHLWKVRRDSKVYQGQPWQRPDVLTIMAQQGYRVSGDERQGFVVDQPNGYQPQQRFSDRETMAAHYGLGYELQPQAGPLTSAGEIALMPEDVEVVPAWIIGLVLVAYVLTIGPVDYLVLGWLRVRKYTWLLFPLVTAAFTILTIGIAHHYMASTDTGGQLTIVDVVDDGRPIRQSTFGLAFHGQQSTVQNDARQSFVVLAQMNIGNDRPYNASTQSARSINTSMLYSGRFPNSFTTTQQVRQWEPQTTRTLTLMPDSDNIPDLPWQLSELVTTASGRDTLTQTLQRLIPRYRELDAIVLHQGQRFPLFAGNGFLFSTARLQAGREWLAMAEWNRRYSTPPREGALAVGILDASARTGSRDFFSVVSQVSPQGSAPLEDLPILDVTDENQWLLIVAARDGDKFRVWRKLYVEDAE